ncbi:MAG: dockerin type I domain-containing protein [Planctomycetota bacterium]
MLLRTKPRLGSRSEFGHSVEHVLTNPGASTFARVYTDVPFSNPANPMDVDGDGFVSPRDALLPINELNQGKSGLLEPPTDNAGIATHLYIDPSKDNFLSPIDALLVINFLNQAAGQGEGEGEHGLEYLPPADVCLPKSDAVAPEHSRAIENAGREHWFSFHSQGLASSNVEHHALASFIGPRPFSAQADSPADEKLYDSKEPEIHDLAIASMDLELELPAI